jgi:hypothetical protein
MTLLVPAFRATNGAEISAFAYESHEDCLLLLGLLIYIIHVVRADDVALFVMSVFFDLFRRRTTLNNG